MQRTALRAAADAERSAKKYALRVKTPMNEDDQEKMLIYLIRVSTITHTGVSSFKSDVDSTASPDGWPFSGGAWLRSVQAGRASAISYTILAPGDKEAQEAARHEDELVNRWTGWFVSSQGLLFASLAFAWQDARGAEDNMRIEPSLQEE